MALHVGEEEEGVAMSDINVTPLVDVMLVLLIIFIITIRVILQQVPLTLPKATNLVTQTRPENITIAVDKQGAIYWNTKLLASQDELMAQLRGIARQEPQPEVHIAVDKFAKYEIVAQTLADLQHRGLKKIGFVNNDFF